MKAQALATLTAAFLHSTLPIQVLGGLLALTAAGGGVLAASLGFTCASAAFGLAFSLAAALAWYALRIHFDARVFAWLAAQPESEAALADFDAALAMLGLRQGGDTRDLAQRARGARRLVTRLAQVVLGQLILVLLGGVLLYAHL
ncbi:MAG: hypothetical protein IPN40_12910 [Uliginosibacterium sp.]|nr:hypothetical protein [Uliginosibacterium sp.]